MGQTKRIACFDIERKEWLVYESANDAKLIMGLNGSAVPVAKLQRSIVNGRYFFCEPEDMELYPEDVILDLEKRRAVKPKKATCHKPVMVFDIRNANKGWYEYAGIKVAAIDLDIPLASVNMYLRSHNLLNKRYIFCRKGEEKNIDIAKVLELPLEDDRYYIWPTSQEEREELFRRLEIGKYNKYDTVEKLRELAIWAESQVEENNLSMKNKIEATMLRRYGTKSTHEVGKIKEEMDIEGFEDYDDEDEPLGEDEDY